MSASAAILLTLALAVTPLSDQQRTALATAYDGRDHEEEAFAVLVENAASWTDGAGDEPIRLRVNPSALRENPESVRGELFQIQGLLAQREALPKPWSHVQEWYVRLGEGEPVIVYVVGQGGQAWREGARVEVPARFYKTMNKTAKDGRARDYPAFVGAIPREVTAAAAGLTLPPLLMPALFVLLAVFAVLILFIMRKRTAASQRRLRLRESGAPEPPDEGPPLPEDPAAALEELRRRAGR